MQGGALEMEEDGDEDVVGELGPVPGPPHMAHAVSLQYCHWIVNRHFLKARQNFRKARYL